jgi:hypothetical protein
MLHLEGFLSFSALTIIDQLSGSIVDLSDFNRPQTEADLPCVEFGQARVKYYFVGFMRFSGWILLHGFLQSLQCI